MLLTIPTKGDIIYLLSKGKRCGRGGIGRRARLRIWWFHRGGSSPFARTITSVLIGFKKFYENTRFLLPYMFHTATQALVSK